SRDAPNALVANKHASCRPCVASCVAGTRSQSLIIHQPLTRYLVGTTCAFHADFRLASMPLSTLRLLGATMAPIFVGSFFYSRPTVEVRLANATVSFGQWVTDPPLDRLLGNPLMGAGNNHELLPNVVTIKAGGAV